MSIWSTPKNPESQASKIRKVVENCKYKLKHADEDENQENDRI